MASRRLLVALFCAWVAAPVHAATVDGIQLPDAITVDGQVLHLNGAGLRSVTVLGIDVYVAALYVPTPTHDAQAILDDPGHKAIVLHFLHSASKQQVEEDFRKGERINCGDGRCDPKEQPDFEAIVRATPAIVRGDTAAYVYDPHRLRVYSNGRLIGDYPNGPLAHQLLLGFLGQHPPTERLKRQLLGLAAD